MSIQGRNCGVPLVTAALIALFVPQPGCRKDAKYKRKTPQLTIRFDWALPEGANIKPAMWGPMMTQRGDEPHRPTSTTSGMTREIDGTVCRGFTVHHGPGAMESKPQALVLEVFAGKELSPRETMDIYIWCKIPVELQMINFESGTIVDVFSGHQVELPMLLEPGEYHLQATEQ